jgi:hypothetical protein
MNKLKLLLLCFSLIGIIQAQEIQLFVKSGVINVSGKTVIAGKIASISQKNDWVRTEINALVLAKKNNYVIELEPGTQLRFQEIDKKFKKRKSAFGSFLEIALNQTQNKQNIGAAIRSVEPDPWLFIPMDSCVVISDSIRLIIGNEGAQIVGDVRLYKSGSLDTLILKELELVTPSPGFYYWDYVLRNNGQSMRFLNYFLVPENEDKEVIRNNLNEYKRSIKNFSQEMQSVLLDEYFRLNKIYSSI